MGSFFFITCTCMDIFFLYVHYARAWQNFNICVCYIRDLVVKWINVSRFVDIFTKEKMLIGAKHKQKVFFGQGPFHETDTFVSVSDKRTLLSKYLFTQIVCTLLGMKTVLIRAKKLKKPFFDNSVPFSETDTLGICFFFFFFIIFFFIYPAFTKLKILTSYWGSGLFG